MRCQLFGSSESDVVSSGGPQFLLHRECRSLYCITGAAVSTSSGGTQSVLHQGGRSVYCIRGTAVCPASEGPQSVLHQRGRSLSCIRGAAVSTAQCTWFGALCWRPVGGGDDRKGVWRSIFATPVASLFETNQGGPKSLMH